MRNLLKEMALVLLKPLRFLKNRLQNELNLFDFDTVYFEGGLGSQILSYILFRAKHEKGEKTLCDITYFQNISSDSHGENQVSLWSYKLDHYGISISDLPNTGKKSRLKIKPKFIPLDFLSIDNEFLKKIKSEIKLDQVSLQNYLSAHDLQVTDPYCVVHLRKGDYVYVASHLISEKQVIALLSKISDFLPSKVFLASDGEIDQILIDWFKENRPNIRVITTAKNIDPFILHDLMRNSRLLIAANSTFSFSAALLSSEQTISFIPQIFYKEDFHRATDSSIHQFASDYALLRY